MRPADCPPAAPLRAVGGEVAVALDDRAADALGDLGLDALHEVLDPGRGELGLRGHVLASRRGLLVEVAAERLDLALDPVAALAQRALDARAALADLALEAVAGGRAAALELAQVGLDAALAGLQLALGLLAVGVGVPQLGDGVEDAVTSDQARAQRDEDGLLGVLGHVVDRRAGVL